VTRREWARVLVGGAVALGTRRAGAEGEPAPEVGRVAPDFTQPVLGGGRVRLGEYRGKKAVLINFWATWCVPCREELPSLERLSRRMRDTLQVLGVSLDTVGAARVRAFARELGLTFPVLHDPDLATARLYRVRGLPASFIVDRAGVIRHRELGYRDWADREARVVVDDALRAR
jgi:peroxiredoxin